MENSLLIGSDNRITSRTSCLGIWLACQDQSCRDALHVTPTASRECVTVGLPEWL